jgi:hypothetical protein
MLVNIYVFEQWISRVNSDLQQPGLAALALEVLHDLVVGGALLLVLGEDAVHAVDGRVSHEFLEVRGLQQEVPDVHAEYHVESRYQVAFAVLVVSALRD